MQIRPGAVFLSTEHWVLAHAKPPETFGPEQKCAFEAVIDDAEFHEIKVCLLQSR